MTKSTVLPDNILRCMSVKDRKALGKAGLTAEEVLAAGEAKTEKILQRQIVSLLRLKGIEPIVSRFGKRTTNNVGTPDILFAVRCGDDAWIWPCAWEVKLPSGKLSTEQHAMASKLRFAPNWWYHRVITSVDMALEELRSMGL